MRRFRGLMLVLTALGLAVHAAAWAGEDADRLYRQGRYDEAEKIYAKLDMDRPKDIRYRYNRGCAAFQKADYKVAVAAFSSVLRRAGDDVTRFKSAFNLGNAVFQQGDFASAAEYYRLALRYAPADEDAAYNLELALRKLERQKQDRKQGNEKSESGQKDDRGEENREPGGQDESGKDRPTSGKDRKSDQGKNEPDREKSPDKDAEGDKRRDGAEEQPRDLEGELKTLQELPEKDPEGKPREQTALSPDRKMAEALFNNVTEDRSRLRRPEERKKRAVKSGKDW